MAADEFTRPADAGDFLDVPEPIRRRIDRERRRLQQASAVLRCLVYAANHDAPEIDCGDVARVALELIQRAIEALDVVKLGEKVRVQYANQ
jgi:hypothetical protein